MIFRFKKNIQFFFEFLKIMEFGLYIQVCADQKMNGGVHPPKKFRKNKKFRKYL